MSNIVTLEQAKILVELGYNIVLHCSCHEYECIGCKSVNLSMAKKLSVSEALDYLREEKEIYCGVHPFMWGYKGVVIIQDKYNPCTIEVEPLDTHPLAESALLTAVLDYLEKKGGEG